MKKSLKVIISSLLAFSLIFGATLSFSDAASTSTAKTIENLKKQVKTLTASNKKKDAEIKKLKAQVKDLEAKLKPKTPTASNLSKTINGVTIKITKVVQDSDSLKIYVTYTNKSKEQAMTGDSLSKIVASGKQFEYDHNFNFPRYYEKNVLKAADFIEPGVTEQSVIFFKPTKATKINIVLNANFDSYRFDNITIKK